MAEKYIFLPQNCLNGTFTIFSARKWKGVVNIYLSADSLFWLLSPGTLLKAFLGFRFRSVYGTTIRSPHKYGFLPGRPCHTNALCFTDSPTEAFNGGMVSRHLHWLCKSLWPCFAHSSVNKLEPYVNPGHLLTLIGSFSRICPFALKAGHSPFDRLPNLTGAPHGLMLVPLMLLIYINVLPCKIRPNVAIYIDRVLIGGAESTVAQSTADYTRRLSTYRARLSTITTEYVVCKFSNSIVLDSGKFPDLEVWIAQKPWYSESVGPYLSATTNSCPKNQLPVSLTWRDKIFIHRHTSLRGLCNNPVRPKVGYSSRIAHSCLDRCSHII